MDAARLQIVLANGGKGDIAFGNNCQRRAIRRVDGVALLPFNRHGFDIGNCFEPIGTQIVVNGRGFPRKE